MLRITKRETVKVEHAYRRMFRSDDECFGFECEEDGTPVLEKAIDRIRFEKCMSKPDKFTDMGRVLRERHTLSCAEGDCECGRHLVLRERFSDPLIRCGCGRMYDKAGNEIGRN